MNAFLDRLYVWAQADPFGFVATVLAVIIISGVVVVIRGDYRY